jgi:hypothetical protein
MGPKAFRFPTPKKWEEARSKEGENGGADGGQGAARPRSREGRQQAVGTNKGLRFTSATTLDQPEGVQEGDTSPGEQVEEEMGVSVGAGAPQLSSSSTLAAPRTSSSSAPMSGSIDGSVSALGGQRTAVSIAPAQSIFEVQRQSSPPAPIDAERGDEKHGKGGEWRVERAPQGEGGGGGFKDEAGGETGAEITWDEGDDPIFDHAMAKMGADAAGKVLKSREMLVTSVRPGFGV